MNQNCIINDHIRSLYNLRWLPILDIVQHNKLWYFFKIPSSLKSLKNLKAILSLHHTTLHFRSCHVTFDSSLTVQSYSRQFNTLTNQRTALGICPDINTSTIGRLITDCLVENMTIYMTLYEM